MRIAVTGAKGFIGRELCNVLREHGHTVTTLDVRSASRELAALRESEAVIHLAGRAHVLTESAPDPAAEFRRVNVDDTLRVADAAVAAGVRRFVFVSSIGVLGNESGPEPFTEQTVPAPREAYAVSKYEAELALRELEQRTGLAVIIVRPPLVYGPHVKGNFLRLMRWVARGVPLPLSGIANRRSFIGVTNLSDMLMLCATRAPGPHRLFVASDGQDVSTPELLRLLARCMGRPDRLFHCPATLLRALVVAAGKQREYRSLTGDLQVDSSLARSVLGWIPQKNFETGIKEMVDWFRDVVP